MNLFVAGALTFALQTSAESVGYDVANMGLCRTMGWSLDEPATRAEFIRLAEASGLSADEFVAQAEDGGARSVAENVSAIEGLTNRREALAYFSRVVATCDALTTSYPGLLERTAETDAMVERRMRGIETRYPE